MWKSLLACALLVTPAVVDHAVVRGADIPETISDDLLLHQTKIKIEAPLKGPPETMKDSAAFKFDFVQAIGDLVPGDRVAVVLQGFSGLDVTGTTIDLGDPLGGAGMNIEMMDAGKGKLKSAKDATIGGFQAQAKYRPIKLKRGTFKKPGKLTLRLRRGAFGRSPLTPSVDEKSTSSNRGITVQLRVLRGGTTLFRNRCFRGDFKLDYKPVGQGAIRRYLIRRKKTKPER